MPFTVVFEGDVKKLPSNPFKMRTEFGRPIVLSDGDLAAECDRFREALSWIADTDPQIVDAALEKFSLVL